MALRRTEHGLIVVSDVSSDKCFTAKTHQCVHCGAHWIPKPGSGTIRGWCGNCAGFVCGPRCKECVPVEQYLENIEKGRPENYRPIIG